MTRRFLLPGAIVCALVFVASQLVPYRVHNPPTTQAPAWNAPQTEALARRACFDCHSNEVEVPWHGHIAPVAWLVRYPVDEGRGAMNLSEMDRPQREAHEAGEEVEEGKMPPGYCLILHPGASLAEAEQQAPVAGLEATLGP